MLLACGPESGFGSDGNQLVPLEERSEPARNLRELPSKQGDCAFGLFDLWVQLRIAEMLSVSFISNTCLKGDPTAHSFLCR